MKSQSLCPRIVEYQFLYPDSKRLREALCIYYAIVMRSCTKAVLYRSYAGPVSSQLFWLYVVLEHIIKVSKLGPVSGLIL